MTSASALSSDDSDVLRRQLHFVCGKGGVGKSVVSCALAAAFVGEGRRTLLAQVNAAADTHAPLLGIRGAGPDVTAAEPGLWTVNLSPPHAMKEYALMTLRFEALYRTVFENRLTKAFLRFVPSLNELVMLGKVWYHAEEKLDDGTPRFERIVVDCPSTGHGVRFLRTAELVWATTRLGPMAEKAKAMAATVRDPRRTAVHVVALPEELPTNEAYQLASEVERTRVAPLGAVVVNQVLPALFEGEVERAWTAITSRADGHRVDDAPLAPLFRVGGMRRRREVLEQAQRARLRDLGRPFVELPMVFRAALDRRDIEDFATILAGAHDARASRSAR